MTQSPPNEYRVRQSKPDYANIYEVAESYIITLTAVGPGPPATVRLRRFLKSALRCHGLKCLAVQAVGENVAAATTAALESIVAEKAKANMSAGGKAAGRGRPMDEQGCQIFGNPIDTRQELAKATRRGRKGCQIFGNLNHAHQELAKAAGVSREDAATLVGMGGRKSGGGQGTERQPAARAPATNSGQPIAGGEP
jgi:hypothetical protein